MPDNRPEFTPTGYTFSRESNRLVRSKDAEGPEFIHPDDHPDAPPTVVYHPTRHVNGHFGRDWRFVPHGVPEGFHFQQGRLVKKDGAVEAEPEPVAPVEDVPAQVVGTEEVPSSIPGVNVNAEGGTPIG